MILKIILFLYDTMLECVEWNAHLISTNFFLLFHFFIFSNKHLQFFRYIIFSFVFFLFLYSIVCIFYMTNMKKYGVYIRSTIVCITIIIVEKKNCRMQKNTVMENTTNHIIWWLCTWLDDCLTYMFVILCFVSVFSSLTGVFKS